MSKKSSWFMVLVLFTGIPFSGCSQELKRIVKTGLEVLIEEDFSALKGKRVALLTNPTGVDSKLRSTVDIFHEAPEVNLVALFGPEHGVRGNFSAGEKVYTSRDPFTGLPVYSLYGKTRKPTMEMLEGIDVLVYDIQDIGCRSYTYISTMGLAMEAAAEKGIEFMVLDRPNPLGGLKIEGNLAEPAYFSLVGAYPIPYVYGLTCGELAQMINDQGWLEKGQKCELTVIAMKGWYRDLMFHQTNLPWVPSSPHIPHAHKAPYYVATGILGELGIINIGIGYTLPFELFGTSFLNPLLLADKLNELFDGKAIFRPITYKPYYGKDQGNLLHGLQLYILQPDKLDLMSVQFRFLEAFHRIYPNVDIPELAADRLSMFDKVCGSDQVRELFFVNYQFADIKEFLEKDIKSFKELSKPYYLYD